MYLPRISYQGKHVASATYREVARYNNTRSRSRRRSAVAPLLNRGQIILTVIAMLLTMSVMGIAISRAIQNDHEAIRPYSATSLIHSITGNVVDDIQALYGSTGMNSQTPAVSQPIVDEPMAVEPEIVPEVVEPEPKFEPIKTTRLGIVVDTYNYDVDYTAAIDEAYAMLDIEGVDPEHVLALCEIYEAQRNIKILDNDMGFEISDLFSSANSYEEIDAIMNPHVAWTVYTEQDVIDLACIIYAEAGSSWCTDRHQQAVGSVVVNRWKSPRWDDDTIREVIDHEGQYPGTRDNRYYDERAYQNALHVLEYGPLYEDAVWQAEFTQGTYTIEIFDYSHLGKSTTYICGGYVYG